MPVTDGWANIRVDETDAQRRRRIETELNTLFAAESIAVQPVKKAAVTGESSWRNLFGGGGGGGGSSYADEGGASATTSDAEPIHYARPTLGDVIASSKGASSSSGGSARQSGGGGGIGVVTKDQLKAPVSVMPRIEDAMAEAHAANTGGGAAGGDNPHSMQGRMAMAKRANAIATGAAGMDWRNLPPCPLKGYSLTDKGLINLSAFEARREAEEAEAAAAASRSWWRRSGPFAPSSEVAALPSVIVPSEDLLELARQSTKFRTATKVLDDARLFSRQHDAATIGFASAMPLMVGAACSMFMLNVVRLVPCTSARNSFMFKYAWTAARGYTQSDMERLAQQFRLPLVLTSPGIMSQLGVALGLGTMAWKYALPSDALHKTPEAYRAKYLEEQDAKAHALSRYLWFVYYHHPTYTAHSKERAATVHMD